MRSKAPLSLMEQIIMVLVFALCAVLCLEIFIYAGKVSRRGESRDKALIEMQSVAETIKASGDAYEDALEELSAVKTEEGFEIPYDSEWEMSSGENTACRIVITMEETEEPYLNRATFSALAGDDVLLEMPVAWQKGGADE